jgi:hypothetical protein
MTLEDQHLRGVVLQSIEQRYKSDCLFDQHEVQTLPWQQVGENFKGQI